MQKWRGYIVCLVMICLGGFSGEAQRSLKHSPESDLQAMHLKGKVKQLYDSIVWFGKRGDTLIQNGEEHSTTWFDTNGNEAQLINIHKLRMLYTYTFDKMNYKMKMVTTYLPDSGQTYTIYKYDSAGNMIEDDLFAKNGTPEDINKYEYDSMGRNIEMLEYYSPTRYAGRMEYKLDSLGNVLEETSSPSDREAAIIYTRTYDSKGNIVTDQNMGNGYITNDFQYTFDNMGNWIKQICLSKEMIRSVTIRKIEYYK